MDSDNLPDEFDAIVLGTGVDVVIRFVVVIFIVHDEAEDSGAVFVIVSRSDGQVDGRQKRFWSQLNNSKTVRDRNPWTGYRIGPSPTPRSSIIPQTGGSKSPL